MADNRTSFDDLFDFNDKQSIETAIKLISTLEDTYQSFVDTVSQQSKKLGSDMDSIKAEAASLLKSISDLNNSAAKNADAYNKVAKGVDDLVTSQNSLKGQIDDNNKTLSNATTQLNNVKKAKEDLVKVNEAEKGSVDDLKLKLDAATKAYKALGDSTSQSIKDDHLKKIADLNNQYKTASGAINDAKKAVDNAAGSYNALNARLNTSKAQLKAMEDGIQGNSASFKALQKQVADDTETLKKWDDKIGDNKRNVGDYKGALSSLIPGFSGVSGAIDTATTAGKAFIASPLGLVIAAIALAVGSLTAYFKGSVEGQDKWNKIMAYAGVILDLFLDGLEAVGKYLSEIPQHLQPVADFLADMWNNPKKYLEQFLDFLKSQVVNRFLAIGDIAQAVGKLIRSGFTDGFKDLGNAVLKLETGFDKVIDKVVDFGKASVEAAAAALKAAQDAAAKRLAIELALADKENLIRKEKIRDVVDDAQTELKVNELLEESKDKIAFADQDRLAKVREARRLLNEQLKGDIDLVQLEVDAQKLRIQAAGGVLIANKKLSEYTNEEIKNIGVKYELIEELAKLEAEQIKISADAATKRKALVKQEIALIQEISNAYFDRQKRERQATDEIDTYIAQSAIKRNQAILDDEDSSLAQRLDAIKSNANEQQKILDINYQKQLDAAKEVSIAKIELDSATTQAIYSDQSKSLEQQIQAEKDAKEAALMNDGKYAQERDIFIKQSDKLYTEYTDNIIANTDKATHAGQENIFKVLDRDWKILTSNINAGTSEQQDKLNQAYIDGTVGMRDFQKQRTKIASEGVKERLTAELDYLMTVLQQTDLTEQKRAEIEAKAADVRKQLSQSTADQILANEQKLRQAINDIAQQGIEFANTLVQAQLQGNIDALNGQIAAEQAKHDKSIALAGDDAQAKAIIDQKFAIKKMELEKKVAAEKRKQAIANKVIAVAETIINTARAISAALPVIPLAVAIGVLGALQVATIIATPIPAYASGTESSAEGLALVGEAGPELGFYGGKATLYDRPTLANLKRGTVIKNASDTESLMETAKKFGDSYMYGKNSKVYDSYNSSLAESRQHNDNMMLIRALDSNKQAIVEAITGQVQEVWDDAGYRRYVRTQNARIELLHSKKHKF